MDRRFLVAVTVMFLLSMGLGILVHEVLLGQDYERLGALFRPKEQMEEFFPVLLLAHALIAAGFVWIYRQGREEKPFLPQGIRYGIAIAVLMTVPVYLVYYAVQPLPGVMVAKQIAFDSLGVIVMGVVVAWLYRAPEQS